MKDKCVAANVSLYDFEFRVDCTNCASGEDFPQRKSHQCGGVTAISPVSLDIGRRLCLLFDLCRLCP